MAGQRDGEHQRAQTLAVRIDRQRARDAAAQRVLDDEVQRAQLRQLVAPHRPRGEMAEMRQYDLGGEFALQHLPALVAVGDDRDVRGVPLVTGTRMGEVVDAYAHAARSSTISGFTHSRGISTDFTARICRAPKLTPPPAPVGPCMCRLRTSAPIASAALRSG